jgi:hypothetical protein
MATDMCACTYVSMFSYQKFVLVCRVFVPREDDCFWLIIKEFFLF